MSERVRERVRERGGERTMYSMIILYCGTQLSNQNINPSRKNGDKFGAWHCEP